MHILTRLLPLVLSVMLLLAALPAIAAPAGPCALHEKAALGLMPAACEGGEASDATAQQAEAPAVTYLSAPVNTTVGSWAQVLAAADVGGDRRAEAAVLTARNFDAANDQRLHLFQQNGAALERLQQFSAGDAPEAAVALDVNLDGRLDVIGALAGDEEIAAFLQGPAYLSDTLTLAQPGAPDALAAGDFSGDLRPDLAVALPLSDTIQLWRSTPFGPRSSARQLPFASDGYNALAVGDFNNDGFDDLAALRGSDDPSGTRSNLITVFLQQAGTFPISFTLSPETGGFLPHSLAAGDVNGDGRDDLVVTAGGNAPNAFLNVYVQGVVDGLARTPTVLAAYHLPSAVAVADVNHDGREDVVVAHDGWRTVSVYTQSAATTLDPYAVATVPYSSRYRPSAMAVADLSGDGGLDVAVVSRTPGLTVLNNTVGAPTAAIVSPTQYANVPHGLRTIAGTTSAGTVAVEVRVRGLTGWLPTTLAGTSWSAEVELPATKRSWWIEARAIDGLGRVQAPPARHRVQLLGRVRDGLVVEYSFEERSGPTLFDRSGVGAPLDLTLADEQAVSRVPEGYFIHTPTAIASPGPGTKVIDALRASNEFTLEAWFRTANLTQDGPARLLTVSEDSQRLNFSLVQSRFDGGPARVGLRLRTSTPPAGKTLYELRSELPLTTELTHVMVTRAANGTVIFYINGVDQGRAVTQGTFSGWDASYKLLLANDALVPRPWLGEYHLASVYRRALSAAEVGQNFDAGPVGDGSPAQLTDAQVVYTFNDGAGTMVADSALVLPALPAQIAGPAATSWSSTSLAVNAATIIASDGPATKVSRASMATGEISVEAWVTPANTTQSGPARIVTISQDVLQRNVTLAQGLWGNQPADLYLARLRSTSTSGNGEPHLNAPAGSLTPRLTHVIYTRDASGKARLFIDGVERASRMVGGELSNWNPRYRLALANEFSMNRTWLGSYHFVAVYSRALTADMITSRFQAGPEGDGAQPPAVTVGPFVQRVTINGGASITADRHVTLAVEAQLPSGRSVGRVKVAEYGFDPARKAWALLRQAQLPATADGTYSWELAAGSGVRYLQTWVIDSTGTTTSYPYQSFINLAPSAATLERGKIHVYRFALSAGQAFEATITAERGDADLYVWGPLGDTTMRWVSNGRGATDQIQLTVPVDGVYQVEVFGYTQTTYRLTVAGALTSAGETPALAAAPVAEQDPDKPLPNAPAVAIDSAPEVVSTASIRVHLPMIRR